MAFYENTIIANQDLPVSEIKKIKEKYNELIIINSLYFSLIFFISETGRSWFAIIVFS